MVLTLFLVRNLSYQERDAERDAWRKGQFQHVVFTDGSRYLDTMIRHYLRLAKYSLVFQGEVYAIIKAAEKHVILLNVNSQAVLKAFASKNSNPCLVKDCKPALNYLGNFVSINPVCTRAIVI